MKSGAIQANTIIIIILIIVILVVSLVTLLSSEINVIPLSHSSTK